MKKICSLLLALLVVFAMAAPAFAGGDEAVVVASNSGMSFIDSIVDSISSFFEDIVNFFKSLFGLNDNVGYYTITYLDSDGSLIGKADYPAGSEISAPPIPEKEGHVFMNWYPAIPDEMPERDITVTAQWAEVK